MASKTKRKDGRLGRFQLGRRCKHAAVELGPIHEAHHVDTGAPSLVMMPGARTSWWPRAVWRVRIHVQVVPPFIGLEVEQSPGSSRLSGLINLLVLVLAGVEAVAHDIRMRTHLTRSRPGQRHWPHLPQLIMGLSLLVLALGLWLDFRNRLSDPPAPASTVSVLGKPGGGVAHPPTLIDQDMRNLSAIGYPLPPNPFAEQAKPPCRVTDGDEHEINGGCWIEMIRHAPCSPDQAEYQGKCYLPVALRKPPRQSVSP